MISAPVDHMKQKPNIIKVTYYNFNVCVCVCGGLQIKKDIRKKDRNKKKTNLHISYS